MKFFGESKKGDIVKYEADGSIKVDDIVHVEGLVMMQSCFIIDFNNFSAERFSVLPCFDNRNYVFAYGHDIGQSRSTVTCLCFFGGAKCTGGTGPTDVGLLTAFYDGWRLSEYGKRVGVQILSDGKFSSGYLISMQVKGYSADLNAATITFTFMTTAE